MLPLLPMKWETGSSSTAHTPSATAHFKRGQHSSAVATEETCFNKWIPNHNGPATCDRDTSRILPNFDFQNTLQNHHKETVHSKTSTVQSVEMRKTWRANAHWTHNPKWQEHLCYPLKWSWKRGHGHQNCSAQDFTEVIIKCNSSYSNSVLVNSFTKVFAGFYRGYHQVIALTQTVSQ